MPCFFCASPSHLATGGKQHPSTASRPDLNTSTLAEAMRRHPQPLAQSTAADVEPSDRHK
ncbi:MAG: hypothetical protein IJT30_09265 [Muribaculaceae bacterium]|nr:hypothetical protein [Muribaculaceae bacterium]